MRDLKLDARLGIYVPTSEYKVGRLANVRNNYWTSEPIPSPAAEEIVEVPA